MLMFLTGLWIGGAVGACVMGALLGGKDGRDAYPEPRYALPLLPGSRVRSVRPDRTARQNLAAGRVLN